MILKCFKSHIKKNYKYKKAIKLKKHTINVQKYIFKTFFMKKNDRV